MPTMENAHALVVGIAAYRHLRPLPANVRNDAEAVAQPEPFQVSRSPIDFLRQRITRTDVLVRPAGEGRRVTL